MRFRLALLACLLSVLSLIVAAAPAIAETPEPSCASGPVTVGDTTYGTPCADVIAASPGVEVVKGGGGDDVILAAPLAAESCPSGCFFGVGSQTFEGGEGDDVVFGERGNDILRGGGGNDQLFGGIGDDLLQGGPGNDRLVGGFGADSIDGEADDDYVRGDSTIDRIFDTGTSDDDVLSYSTGITPGFGGTGPSGFGTFPGATGERGLRFDMGATGQNANNGVAPFGGGVDEVEVGRFEVVIGTPFSDYLIGTGGEKAIYGGGGGDILVGNGAEDVDGGAHTDYEDGGSVAPRDASKVSVGFMTPPGATPYTQLYLVGSTGGDQVSVTYDAGPPAKVSFQLGGASFDTTPANTEDCTFGGGGVEIATCTLSAPLDSLLLAGMDGNDVILAPSLPFLTSVVAIGGADGDSITGGDAENILVDGPGTGQDVLTALGGDDALTHNGGADELLGGNGNDLFLSDSVCDGERIVGGAGRDNSSWARFDEGVHADLGVGRAGRPGTTGAPACAGGTADFLTEIEDLEGSSFGDILYGDAGPNQLLGHPGADVYFAAAGDDSILANSGDADQAINCGADVDSATIDRPQHGDPAPVECESVYEADPNNFRNRTLLPPPPLVAPPPPPPPPKDRRPPQTRLTRAPARVTFTARTWRTVAFRFASSEAGSSFRCKLDRKPYRGCSSPRPYRVRVGRHAFRVIAVDRAGNVDPTPALFKFRVRRR